jgi:hypothetical protein
MPWKRFIPARWQRSSARRSRNTGTRTSRIVSRRLYRLEIVRVRRGSEDKLPPPDDRCLLCNERHEPAPRADGRPVVRRVIISIADATEDASIPP